MSDESSPNSGRRAPPPHRGKRQARERALQALYQWELNSQDIRDIEKQFLDHQDMSRVDITFFSGLLHGVPTHLREIDEPLSMALDRPIEDLDPIERTMLRLAVYEFIHHPETPKAVVINEAIEITRRYGADQGHKYVNGVLDKLAPRLRPHERGRST